METGVNIKIYAGSQLKPDAETVVHIKPNKGFHFTCPSGISVHIKIEARFQMKPEAEIVFHTKTDAISFLLVCRGALVVWYVLSGI